MTFTDDTWSRIAAIRTAIDELPFVRGLADGTLDRQRFVHYLAQDALYLGDYSRALAGLAAQSTVADDALFWSRSAASALVVERELHGSHVADLSAATMSPTCRAYTSYLLARQTEGCYPVAAAAVLPCYWIYQDVGDDLLRAAGGADGDLAGHPYADWISMYADAEFAESVEQAKAIVDRLAASADPAVVDRMHEAFATAARYEWMFWDAAWREEGWPV
ncbi:TenA family protein [Arsenicicoccus piscis]|uniref:Aminopyrimidine aminohydrolase n=1 Tax=Arsenicicoccus piscis TaxID=673954 RepID=A0ABQ6HQY0_9MICO|nr:TenA family protein [Arsenicicoccus piscis]MCH8626278.1 TenA family protein [Arsenicicoccus piscis]GMA20875.1 aminopyrimidine aminohydrolase [Arsenicicoccus piscis]